MLVAPLEHLLESAAGVGDTATVREVAARVVASQARLADYDRWLIARTLGDTAALSALRARFDAMELFNLASILNFLGGAQFAADFDHVVTLVRQRVSSAGELNMLVFRRLRIQLLNGGRPMAWSAALERAGGDPALARTAPHTAILDALYWNGDSALAGEAARRLAPGAATGWSREAVSRELAEARACALASWQLRAGQAAAARELARGLARAGSSEATACGAMIDAELAIRDGRPDAAALVERLDSLLREDAWLPYGGLVLARLREARGDIAGALAALQRVPANQPFFYGSTYLAEEGRLAARSGDQARAARARERYLALRFNSEQPARD